MSSSVGFLPDLKGRGIRLEPPVNAVDAVLVVLAILLSVFAVQDFPELLFGGGF